MLNVFFLKLVKVLVGIKSSVRNFQEKLINSIPFILKIIIINEYNKIKLIKTCIINLAFCIFLYIYSPFAYNLQIKSSLDTNIGRSPKIQFPLKVYNTRFRARNMGHDKRTRLEMNHQKKKMIVLKESSQNLLVSSVNF